MALITKIKTVYSEVIAALGFTPENSANRAQPNGYAGLDSGGKVPAAQLPLASASTTGALSSTDWATFNAKQAALSGAGIVKSTNGTISYLTDNTANWGTAYNRSLTSATVTGTTTKTLTLNQQGGTNITASWSDLNTDAVTSVFGRTGAVVATEGDYSLTQLSDVNLTSPTNGQLLQNNGTQWVNWTPNYLTANQVVTLSGDVTGTGATAITATLANTTVTAGTYGNATQAPQITIDSKGRATSAGNVTITPAWSSVTGTPTTISGYGITNGVTLTGAQILTNKTFTDSSTFFQDNLDNTKKAQFELSNISTATTRTYTLPNVNGTLITNQDYTANDVLTKIKTVDGTGSGLDADTLDGYELATAVNQGPTFPCIPLIKSDGVMEVGRYLDFHSSSNDGIDYIVRLDTENTTRVFTLPSASGRLIGSGDTATVTNTMLAGSIANSKLNTITTAGKVANSATTATNLNTVNAIVSRDASGNFETNKITFNSGTFSAPSLVIGANTNTGLYSSAANSLDFTVNSIRRVAIDTEGFKSFGSGNINTNSAIGANSLIANTTGFQNTAIGVEALKSNTTGFSNTGLGAYSLSTNTTGNNNTAVGIAALQKQTTADGNTAVGLACLQETTTGFYNTSIGGYGLFFNTTGNNNTAIGYASSYNNTTGIYNTAIGVNSLYSNITTNYNTAIGAGALINNTGSGNSALGSQYTSSGVYDPAFDITTQNNLLSLGHKLITTAYINVSWTIVSDARDKTNFAKVPYGIDFVKKLKPVSYERKIKREEEKGDGKVRYGFLAQDILELEGDKPVLVDNNDKEHLYLNENSLIPILVNAIQELQQQIEELKNA